MRSGIVYLDGAMGTMLMNMGFKEGCPELLNVQNPDVVKEIHEEYILAGAQIIETNTFGGNRVKLGEWGLEDRLAELNAAGVKLAREAAEKYPGVLVAASVGPTGKLVQPVGDFSFDEAYNAFYEQIKILSDAGADIILIETMSVLNEARAAVLAAKEATDKPVLCSMTFDQMGRTLSGTDVETAAVVLSSLGVDGVGINCSLGPREMVPLVENMVKASRVPVFVQPNAGLPVVDGERLVYPVGPEEYASACRLFARAGVSLIGGCCGTTPAHIKKMVQSGLDMAEVEKRNDITALASAVKTVWLSEKSPLMIIGERINPTGRKELAKALKDGDIYPAIQEGLDQVKAGANVLDVNVGVPGIDEIKTMVDVVLELQAMVRVPLCIDSSNPEAIEGALRYYQGKALVNSVNGQEESIKTILPLVKKYGAAVIGLTMDEQGIPAKAEGRFRIAKKIVDKALKYGISLEDIFIDCITLTASSNQDSVMETIKAIKLVKENLGVKTVLGVSNVSFGLPDRKKLNGAFLAMAIGAGLDAVIINPSVEEYRHVIKASEVLSGRDEGAERYILAYGGKSKRQKDDASAKGEAISDESLYQSILEGNKAQAIEAVKAELVTKHPLEVIDKIIVPALNEVGDRYESGQYFLPQLIKSAGAVQGAFDVIKEKFPSANESKGKIVLATVKGDIHDIGKNIVRALLENYGYEVIDLGKDVSPEDVLKAVVQSGAGLVGLSALMTTSLKAMEVTVKLIKEKTQCKVMVGGAVVTQDYACSIGADFYGKDAMEAVKIAEKVF
uniref:homocysteine S-methyltransferase family protein n=1 Tax=Caldanaerobius polysaccharolyticus TaxID=44256 RepID=UPI00054D8ED6